ncbi:hypothetical protein [Ancylobacter polymorphus]|jgi:hypothetical protein|uniref:Sulfotransferase domain-containing protein n=1 Tax=Ancylobacter polymorphus TaxID=223390 RepID=A0A9E6ZWE0_9HYPH|nr:hypothetical protein [Ancylobacter polymorphus]UOK69810.1 hypothetical protein K9D25_13775 [Ancylobacter polymorphus]
MAVIIHIGLHKTGSSAIQQFLALNASALGSQGVFYAPTMPEWPNHSPLADAFRIGQDSSLGERLLEDLLRRSQGRELLISSEMFCEPQIEASRFLDLLGDQKKKVIAYIRHPCDIVLSAFGERVKYYPNQYTSDVNDHPLAYDPGQLDVLTTWIARNDIELILAPYDRRQWHGGSLCVDFLRMIGASPDQMRANDFRVNESLSYTSVEILRRALLGGIEAHDFDVLLDAMMRLNFRDDRYPLTDENLQFCFERMRYCIGVYQKFFRSGFDEEFLFEPRSFRG